MHTRHGNPLQSRVWDLERELETERAWRKKAELQNSSRIKQVQSLKSAERKERRKASAIMSKHEGTVSSIMGMSQPTKRYSEESKILEEYMKRWQKEDWVELMLRVLARQQTDGRRRRMGGGGCGAGGRGKTFG